MNTDHDSILKNVKNSIPSLGDPILVVVVPEASFPEVPLAVGLKFMHGL